MIPPTVGRIVYFWLEAKQREPIAAIITKVIRDDLIYLTCFHPNNIPEAYIDIPINHEVKSYPYADWMEYQKGQANKTEETATRIEETEKRLIAKIKEVENKLKGN